MIITVNVKLVNSKFDQAYADKENEGFETEDNYRFLWEDEFEVSGKVKQVKVNNSGTYTLAGVYPNNKEFSFTINNCMLIECYMQNDSVVVLPFSKKAVSKTEKNETEKGITYNVYLKSAYPVVNPMTGVYILKEDFPEELIALINEEDADEEE